MDKAYWTQRADAEAALARGTTNEQTRLIHLELARRYRLMVGLPAAGAAPKAANAPEADQSAGMAPPPYETVVGPNRPGGAASGGPAR